MNADTVEDVKNVMYGTRKTVTVPSGRKFIIREQNGEDDDILSNPLTAKDLSNLDIFLAGIILKEIVEEKEVSITTADTKLFLKNDRTALLFESRIHSIGDSVEFIYDFGDDKISGGKFTFKEDLKQYLHDYSKDFPEEGDEGYFEFKIPPYPAGAYGKHLLTTSSGKELRYNLLDCESDKWLMSLPIEEGSRNAILRARNLELKVDGMFKEVINFRFFSKREIDEIHKHFEVVDKEYNPITKIAHPRTGQIVNYPILQAPSFFYPVEI